MQQPIIIRKAILAIMAMALPFAFVQAQTNPKSGYIITNDNDTVRGTIDYLSAGRMARTCRFKAAGEGDFREYRPGEIRGFRFDDNGVFYVTQTLPVEDASTTFFAEYLLQGGVSLYHYAEKGENYYFLTDEEGKTATIKVPTEQARNDDELMRVKRDAVADAWRLLSKSRKAQDRLWQETLTSENLTSIVREYDMEYCRSAGDCVVFQYDKAKTREVRLRLRVMAGVASGHFKLEHFEKGLSDLKINAFSPQVGVGVDFLLPRLSRGLSLQAMVTASYWSLSKRAKEYGYDTVEGDCVLRCVELNEQVGVAYRFGNGKRLAPVVRGGLSLGELFEVKRDHIRGYYAGQYTYPQISLGFYVGAGVEMPIGSHSLRLTANYTHAKAGETQITSNLLSVNAGIAF